MIFDKLFMSKGGLQWSPVGQNLTTNFRDSKKINSLLNVKTIEF